MKVVQKHLAWSSVMAMLLSIVLVAPAHAGENPWLGVEVAEVPFDELGALNHGVRVTQVMSDSPAQQAGIQTGDILHSLDGSDVYSVSRLQWLVRSKAVGDEVRVGLQRDGLPQELKVVLAAWEHAWRKNGMSPHHQGRHHKQQGVLGVSLQRLNSGLREYFGVDEGQGMLVAEVREQSAAAKAGIQVGDVVVRMDRKEIHGMRDVYQVIEYFNAGDKIDVVVIRDKKTKTLSLTFENAPESSLGHGSCVDGHQGLPNCGMPHGRHHSFEAYQPNHPPMTPFMAPPPVVVPNNL